MRIPWRVRLPWFAVWVPVALLLYTLVNGAGHILVAHAVLGIPENTKECVFMLKTTEFVCSPWGFLILPILAIFAFVSWKLCPQWSPSVRWAAGMLGILLYTLFLLLQAVLLCPRGWWGGMPTATQWRVCADQLWRPHFCRPVLQPFDWTNWTNPSSAWKAQASDIAAFLDERDVNVYCAVAELLGRQGLGDKSLAPQFAKRLEDANPLVRRATMGALIWLGDESIAPQIVKRLGDPDRVVRIRAVVAIRALDGKPVTPQLAKLLEDSDLWVRKEAARTLRTFSGAAWSDDKLEASARAWWAQHKDDPEWKGP